MNGYDLIAHCLKAEGVTWMPCFPANPLIEAAARVGIRPPGVPPRTGRHQRGGRLRAADSGCASRGFRLAIRSRRRELLRRHRPSLGRGRTPGVPARWRGLKRLRRVAKLLRDEKLCVGDQTGVVHRPHRPHDDADPARVPHRPPGPPRSRDRGDARRRAWPAGTRRCGGTIQAFDGDAFGAVPGRHQGRRGCPSQGQASGDLGRPRHPVRRCLRRTEGLR